MKIDYIAKEELLRSLPVYFFCFLIIGFLNMEGYISISGLGTFILALFFTAIHFSFMVWYRKKEQIDSNSIFFIIDHILSSRSYEEKTAKPHDKEISIFSSLRKNASLLTITLFLYIAYLYASLIYHIDQIFWILVLLFVGGALSKIIYGERKEDQNNPVRLLFFYVIACVFIFVRYLVLDYPILPVLKGSIILGILLVLLVLGIKWSNRRQNSI